MWSIRKVARCHVSLLTTQKFPSKVTSIGNQAVSQRPVALGRRKCNICTVNLRHPEETEIIQYWGGSAVNNVKSNTAVTLCIW